MALVSEYRSPLGRIDLICDDKGLTGLLFEGQSTYEVLMKKLCAAGGSRISLEDMESAQGLISSKGNGRSDELTLRPLYLAREWLDQYFSGIEPTIKVPLHLIGTEFQLQVWHLLCGVAYGQTTTYGELARMIACKRGIAKMSAQAIGNAVGHNPISLIVPCHRVLGSDGSLTGYAGGIERKRTLLRIEGGLE